MSALEAKSWPFEQARALVKRLGLQAGSPYPGRHIVFETGFGPSGSPHVGTFAEVVRTNMVRNAFERLAQEVTGNKSYPSTILTIFADDYDALRAVPKGLPKEMEADLGLPLTRVRDTSFWETGFSRFQSFGERNVADLRGFCTTYLGFSPAIASATQYYQTGRFNDGLLKVCKHYQEIMDIMLPTLGLQGSDRRETYSPIMPISPTTGRVLQVPVKVLDASSGLIEFQDEDGTTVRQDICWGGAKLQWKIDWAMRWVELGVDYEMYGKDLIDSYAVSSKIARVLGGQPPVNMFYELFLDEHGQKISKSKGNGLPVETWMNYGTPEALSMFMFQSPKSAKKLHLGLIPKVTDDYLKARSDYPKLLLGGEGKQNHFDSPAWHIHGGEVPPFQSEVNYSLLINLASVANAPNAKVLSDYLDTYREIAPADRHEIDRLLPLVVTYVDRIVLPEKLAKQREPSKVEWWAIKELADRLHVMDDGLDGEAYQFEVYEWGKSWVVTEPETFPTLRDTFRMLYEVFFGAESGPRFGTFVAAYGRVRTIEMLRSVPGLGEQSGG